MVMPVSDGMKSILFKAENAQELTKKMNDWFESKRNIKVKDVKHLPSYEVIITYEAWHYEMTIVEMC